MAQVAFGPAIEYFDGTPPVKIRRATWPANDYVSWPYITDTNKMADESTTRIRDNYQKRMKLSEPNQFLFYYSAASDKFTPWVASDNDRLATNWDTLPPQA